jgi:hypothetical protein
MDGRAQAPARAKYNRPTSMLESITNWFEELNRLAPAGKK